MEKNTRYTALKSMSSGGPMSDEVGNIRNMCNYTEWLLTQHMVTLATLEYGSEQYQKLYDVYFAELSLLGLWATERAMINGQVSEKILQILCQDGMQLHEMEYREDGTFSFKVGGASDEMNVFLGGYTYLDEMPTETSLSIGYQNLHDAREELEGYWSEEISKHLFGIAWGVTCDEVPTLGMAAKYIDGANQVYEMIEGYYAMRAKLEEMEHEELARIFATGGGCNIGGERMHCFYGLFDPEIYRRMLEIEQVGVAGLMGWDEMMSETVPEKNSINRKGRGIRI